VGSPGKRHRVGVRGSVVMTCAVMASIWSSGAAAASVWTVQNSQDPPHASVGQYLSVSCDGATHCMAVGYWFGTTHTKSKTLAESWNGTSYVIVHTPNPNAPDDQLKGVSCTTANECFAVGEALSDTEPIIEQWSDGVWHLLDFGHEGTSLNGVSCVTPSFCMAVGATGTDKSGLVDSWNGSVWVVDSTVKLKGYASVELSAVSCNSPTMCVAVGSATDSENDVHLLAVTWNGSHWIPNVLAYPSSSDQGGLVSVSCPATNGCMAVGWANGSKGKQPVVEQWNGLAWTSEILPSGSSGSGVAEAESVSCTSTTACETVGEVVDTWAANWNGRTWTVDQTVDQPGVAILYGASCTESGGCAAVGWWDPGGTSFTDAEHTS